MRAHKRSATCSLPAPRSAPRLTRRELALASLGLLAGGAGLAGCHGGRSATAPQPENAGDTTGLFQKATVNYAFIPRTAAKDDPFFEAALRGTLQAKRDLETADPKLEIS